MCAACSAQSDDPEHTDPIRAAIIKDSIANYQQNYRNCPCPYTIRDVNHVAEIVLIVMGINLPQYVIQEILLPKW